MLKIDEFVSPDGTLAQTMVSVAADSVVLHQRPGTSAGLPLAAIAVVMRRYGRPFDSAGPVASELVLPDGSRLWVFRHHAAVDATGRDYVAWQSATASEPPLAAIAISVAAALRHLAQLGNTTAT